MGGRGGKDEPTRMNIQTTPPRRDVRRSSRSYKGVRSGTDRRGEVTKQNLMSLLFVHFLHDSVLSKLKIQQFCYQISSETTAQEIQYSRCAQELAGTGGGSGGQGRVASDRDRDHRPHWRLRRFNDACLPAIPPRPLPPRRRRQ